MNLSISSTTSRCIILPLLILYILLYPLLPAGYQSVNRGGTVTVVPSPYFLLGSNLTVYCHVRECERSYKISLDLNGVTVKDREEVNCSLAMFNLTSVHTPQSFVICKLRGVQSTKIVTGLDLHGGLPPDKPEDIICEVTRSSDFIGCSWKSGQKTHLPTTYNISVNRENGTQIYLDQIQNAEEIKIPRGIVDKSNKYQLIITAYNHFGVSQSNPFILCVKDIVIPDTPHITNVEFENGSISAVLQWHTGDLSVHLKPYVRLRTHHSSWDVREETELSETLIRVGDVTPLTEYEFQVRTCNSTFRVKHITVPSFPPAPTSSQKLPCSKWSSSVLATSPGKGPSQRLSVWRVFNSQQNVTVFWKPPPPQDYSGEVKQYNIFLASDQIKEVTCPEASCHCSVLVPAEVQTLSISAVASYGSSPPAEVPLRHSGEVGPVLSQLAPATNGSAVYISWSWPQTKSWSTSGGEELLHYVVQWGSVPATELRWQEVDKNQNSTSITGLTAGVRYNVSLFAVTTRGVTAPSSVLIYSKEQKPASGPNLTVLVHEAKRIQILWDELPVNQQRGFITSYTLYIQALDSSNKALRVVLSGSGSRHIWLDCPEGALSLQMTASTSAGESQRGIRVNSQPADPTVGVVIEVVVIIALFIAIVVNLMCWSCVRKRIKQKCLSWGPAWLDVILPELENSNAIRLLQNSSEPCVVSTDSDPLLSPVSLISLEGREDVYPVIHVETSQTGPGQTTAQAPSLETDVGTVLVDSQLQDISYKPQISMLASQLETGEETEEEPNGVAADREEDTTSSVFKGLLGGLLSSVEVDCSVSHPQTLSSVGDPLWPKAPETSGAPHRCFRAGTRGAECEVEVNCASVELQQGDTMTPDIADTCLSTCTVATVLTHGYFPQLAAVSCTSFNATQNELEPWE
ncbi:interleukin-23 receptor isoform X2 [Solea solea]|uniref:interleukin-23 receptor isoform X2 n=1 Tax=Solea solea TaxID=90069 RepID=UPI00272977D5|nr:interleukin-23 receptor isoform X2 [Solea solea]